MKLGIRMIAAVLAMAAALFTVSCSPSAGLSGMGDKVVNSCSSCHALDKVCEKLGQKDMDAWSRTVFGMKQRGAKVEDKDITVMAEYLAGLKPGSEPVCK